MTDPKNDSLAIHRYLNGSTFSFPRYFYILHTRNGFKNIPTSDTVLLRSFLSRPNEYPYRRSLFLVDYSRLQVLTAVNDSVLVHGYQPSPGTMLRNYQNLKQYRSSVKIKYEVSNLYGMEYNPSYGQRTYHRNREIPYYMRLNRYEYLDRAREKERSER